ncbi:hypothetical protein FB567DRAFT_606471 [Paraphoma chrysanthemicola]|uniref:Uncharacterized protein n=1 Tax=Paraphoma chrysanthemicola TaxID=798071 RepID=A0A8K0VVX2_9PLEO|nr:hypothetical protein FB567DRAFT_606471 [Paraphoma chrysanthemicola]
MEPHTPIGHGAGREGERSRKGRYLRQICFTLMLTTGIVIFCIGLATHDKQASRATTPIASAYTGVRLWLLILLSVWALLALIFLGITLHYARVHPIWALLHFLVVLLMLAFFSTYLHLDAFDLHFWGPLAVDLGLVFSIGIEAVYHSADRGLMRKFCDFVMGNETHHDNMSVTNNYPLVDLPPSAHVRTRRV